MLLYYSKNERSAFMNNKKKLNKLLKKLDKLLIDRKIKELIIDKIDFYSRYGKIYIDNDFIYGTHCVKNLNYSNPRKEFLEIKIINNNFICNYSEWENEKVINIVQKSIKGGNTRVYKKEETNNFAWNNNNKLKMQEQQKIYNCQNELVFESILEKEYDYYTYSFEGSKVIYSETDCSNRFSLEKKWYIQNGSIIKYNLSKSFISQNDEVCENYSICLYPYSTETDRVYEFIELDKEIFKDFMTGKTNINELIDKIQDKRKLLYIIKK